jgi:serine/threonine protein kinase
MMVSERIPLSILYRDDNTLVTASANASTPLSPVDTYVNGIVDLAMEAKFLAALQHPNIISLRGISDGEPCSQSYFVVLDRLYDILTVRLLTWKKHKPSAMRKMMGGNCKRAKAMWLERMNVAHDVASALKYLHSRQ